MKILIAGEGKTGTTAIACAISKAYPNFPFVFEPTIDEANQVIGRNINLIVKSLIALESRGDKSRDLYRTGYFDKFDKRIFIVRDPRDKIISLLLYSGGFHKTYKHPKRIRKSIELLQKKESDNSVSLLELWEGIFGFDKERLAFLGSDLMTEPMSNYDHYLLKYESFIDGNVSGLCDYLEVNELDYSIDICKYLESKSYSREFTRVIRTKRYDNWKNWFTADDVEFFKPILEPYLIQFGYDNNWELNEKSVIESKYCSEYFINRVDERRRNDGLGDWRNI
jgi:hypothetical protein